jgi:hypothetical protein
MITLSKPLNYLRQISVVAYDDGFLAKGRFSSKPRCQISSNHVSPWLANVSRPHIRLRFGLWRYENTIVEKASASHDSIMRCHFPPSIAWIFRKMLE